MAEVSNSLYVFAAPDVLAAEVDLAVTKLGLRVLVDGDLVDTVQGPPGDDHWILLGDQHSLVDQQARKAPGKFGWMAFRNGRLDGGVLYPAELGATDVGDAVAGTSRPSSVFRRLKRQLEPNLRRPLIATNVVFGGTGVVRSGMAYHPSVTALVDAGTEMRQPGVNNVRYTLPESTA